MKYVLGPVVAMAVLGCESEKISQCGYACKGAGTKMVGWSPTDVCRCDVNCADRDDGR